MDLPPHLTHTHTRRRLFSAKELEAAGERVSAAAALTRGRPHGGRGPEDPAAPALRKTRPWLPRPGALLWLPFAAGGAPGHPWRGQRGRRGCGGPSSPSRALAFPSPGRRPGETLTPRYAEDRRRGPEGTGVVPVPGIVVSRGSCLPPRSPARSRHPGREGPPTGVTGSPCSGGDGRTWVGPLGSPPAPGGTRVGRVSAGRALPPAAAGRGETGRSSQQETGDFHPAAPVGSQPHASNPAAAGPAAPRGFCAARAEEPDGGRVPPAPSRPPASGVPGSFSLMSN